ncbi:ATP-binding protein [Thermodesulfobacteriota bacterium]
MKIWKRISIRLRIYLILASLVFITVSGSLVMVWYTYRIEGLLTYIIDRNVAAFQVAEALETALVNQKGFVSYFFLDGDADWLKQLGEYRQVFRERLKEASSFVVTERQKEALNLLASEYNRYIELKDRVITHYKAGERIVGSRLHHEARDHFFKTLESCEEYKALYSQRIAQVRSESLTQGIKLRIIAGTAILIVLCLSVILAIVLIKHILEPVRRLAMEAGREKDTIESGNDVKSLSESVRGLIEDVDQTHLELDRSRETLLQAEKMAMVGKLAAGVAHSIRNPLTSVMMRLFSLNRTLDMSPPQKEDFEVISEEISHIDTIVQNFLEFSRPPKLKMQKSSLSDVVDLVLQLLRHRLESSNMDVILHRQTALPEIRIDPEQMNEVLVNLIVNACESIEGNGLIDIFEEEGFIKSMGKVVIIRLTDNGPGIMESIKKKVLQPFFTTKEDGTGLGLSIVERIVENHGGRLDLKSKEGQGTTFTITLPVKETIIEHDPDH